MINIISITYIFKLDDMFITSAVIKINENNLITEHYVKEIENKLGNINGTYSVNKEPYTESIYISIISNNSNNSEILLNKIINDFKSIQINVFENKYINTHYLNEKNIEIIQEIQTEPNRVKPVRSKYLIAINIILFIIFIITNNYISAVRYKKY